uniref:Putative LAGLIDADG homing endonuclease n=1 Tax=Sykidion marinum TaxID=44573 RepID=A0A1W6EGN1_SYKMA|nr:putative LAGLIDADG homing endonuclease [Pseudoneochloris marina]ARK14547.1 putative LAGLIDADG homing endonuclease [Pseudoneochloris marina]
MKKKNQLTTRCSLQPSNIGSSETTREAPLLKTFNFDNYFELYQPQHINLNNSKFLEWFIGFSEGDGSFINSRNRCYFIINQKDIKLLYKIRKSLGFGKVICYTQNNQTYGHYIVQDQKNCQRLASIFNGNLVLNKTNERFQKWLLNLNIESLSTKGSLSLNTAWLAGFIDAKGCFYARVRKHAKMTTGYQVIQKFSIGQIDELELLLCLKTLLQTNAKVQKIFYENHAKPYYRIEICSLLSNDILLNYLTNFPCLGQKTIAIKNYKRINGYLCRKDHLQLDKIEKIKKLCYQLNKHMSLVETYKDKG